MSNTSKGIYTDHNNMPVGIHAGKDVSKIFHKGMNQLVAAGATDAAEDISKSSHSKLTSKGSPDKDLFAASKP